VITFSRGQEEDFEVYGDEHGFRPTWKKNSDEEDRRGKKKKVVDFSVKIP